MGAGSHRGKMLLLQLLLGTVALASVFDGPYTKPYSDTTCMAGSRPGCGCQLRATLSDASEISRATASCGNAVPLARMAQILTSFVQARLA